MNDYNYKLENSLFPIVENINNPIILELGVQKGRSTKKFLEICEKIMENFFQLILIIVRIFQRIKDGIFFKLEMIIFSS